MPIVHDGATPVERPAETEERPQPQEEIAPYSFLRLPLFQWKSFLLFLGISLALFGHWLTTSEIFDIPEDVQATRDLFYKAKEGYISNQSYWDAKQQYFVTYVEKELLEGNDVPLLQRLQETPGEILISYLVQKMHQGMERIEQIAIYPKDVTPCTLLISKYEPGIWPLKIMLSLELEVKIHAHRFSLSIVRLRRGSQDLALGLAWAYFGPELERIRQLETPSNQPLILLSKFDSAT